MADDVAETVFAEPEAGPTWAERAQLEPLEAVLDPADRRGRKNFLIDRVHKLALGRAMGDIQGKAILDFGCGTGRLSDWLVGNGARVEGVDSTPEMVHAASKRVPHANFRTIEGPALPFADEDFDFVVTAYVLQYYVRGELRIEGELERVLRRDGKLIAIEQVADDVELGRGGTIEAYEEMLSNAGFRLASTSQIRLGQSRILGLAHRLPILARLPIIPSLVTIEARGREGISLTKGRYADVVFCATKAQA